jgi:hypothetical protein
MDECEGELIDGTWYGCGGCEECDEAEYEAIEADVEMGQMAEAEALALHARNGAL